jgi:hypothetical protein
MTMAKTTDREIADFRRYRAAAIAAVSAGHVLHFNAPVVPPSRSNPAGLRVLSGTVGRVVHAVGPDTFAVLTYGNECMVLDRDSATGRKVVGRIDEEHPTAERAVRDLCALLGVERRVPVLRAALGKAFLEEVADAEGHRIECKDRRRGEAAQMSQGSAAKLVHTRSGLLVTFFPNPYARSGGTA